MANLKFVAPELGLNAFNCPHCQVYAKQQWYGIKASYLPVNVSDTHVHKQAVIDALKLRDTFSIVGETISGLAGSKCSFCSKFSIWNDDDLVYPKSSVAPQAHEDMPDALRQTFEEARLIARDSPRGAAALLRLALEQLCGIIEQQKKPNINDCIEKWVRNGMDTVVQEALDSVRVVGNHALHPGKIGLNDDSDIASPLFNIVNFIIEKKISEPKRASNYFKKIVPTKEKQKIAKRDYPNSQQNG